jgi:hypothetical protein
MTKKTEIALAALVILALLGIMVWFVVGRRDAVTPSSPSSQATQTTPDPEKTPTTAPATPVTLSASTTAMIFAERFNSYSSESDFANMTDILPLVTASLETRLQNLARAQREAGPAESYYGISTKVISERVESQTETSMTLILSTQRQESVGSPSNTTVRYQDITVKLIKEGDTWKVDDFSWAN